jgi:biopolymer transport protein ExbB
MLPEWFNQLGLMAWPLAGCSVITLMICLERLVFHTKVLFLKNKTYNGLSEYLTKHKHLEKDVRDEMLEIMLSELRIPYFSGTRLLRTIGTISPILGLLGTILGIIAAFKVIAAQTGPVSPNMIADGLWEAMLTTAAGLFIALPALLFAYLFQHLAEKRLNDFCMRLNKLSMSFEINKSDKEDNAYPDNIERLSA